MPVFETESPAFTIWQFLIMLKSCQCLCLRQKILIYVILTLAAEALAERLWLSDP